MDVCAIIGNVRAWPVALVEGKVWGLWYVSTGMCDVAVNGKYLFIYCHIIILE